MKKQFYDFEVLRILYVIIIGAGLPIRANIYVKKLSRNVRECYIIIILLNVRRPISILYKGSYLYVLSSWLGYFPHKTMKRIVGVS